MMLIDGALTCQEDGYRYTLCGDKDIQRQDKREANGR